MVDVETHITFFHRNVFSIYWSCIRCLKGVINWRIIYLFVSLMVFCYMYVIYYRRFCIKNDVFVLFAAYIKNGFWQFVMFQNRTKC